MRADFARVARRLTLAFGLVAAAAHGVDMEYDSRLHIPLSIDLKPDSERTLVFPQALRRARVPGAVRDKLQVQVAGRSAHLRAASEFKRQRLIIDTLEGDGLYLVDVRAAPDAQPGDAVVMVRLREAGTRQRVYAEPTPILLTRYGALQMYAPARLMPRDDAIHRYGVSDEAIDPPLIQGATLEYRLLGAWRDRRYHLTAVHVRNLSRLRLPLDPRLMNHGRIRGDWLTSTFQHRWLEPAGSAAAADSTVLYLVSARPFHQSLVASRGRP